MATTPKQKLATPPAPIAAPPAGSAPFPTLSIIEGRIHSGRRTQFQPLSVTLVRQVEPMIVRTINAAIAGRWYQAVNELGWVPVEPNEVAGGLSGDMRLVDGHIVVGEAGKEILCKMPERLYNAVQHAKQSELDRRQQSRSHFAATVVRDLERDAKASPRRDAEGLERQADAVGAFDLQEFNVTKERVAITPSTE